MMPPHARCVVVHGSINHGCAIMKSSMLLNRFADRELSFCLWANRICAYQVYNKLFDFE
jgi:hypothetical protein